MSARDAKRLASEIKHLAQRLYELAPLDPDSRPRHSRNWGRGDGLYAAKVRARGAVPTAFIIEREQIEKTKAVMATGAFRSRARFYNAAIAAYDPLSEDELRDAAVILASGQWPVTPREAIRYALANTARLLAKDARAAAVERGGCDPGMADGHEGLAADVVKGVVDES